MSLIKDDTKHWTETNCQNCFHCKQVPNSFKRKWHSNEIGAMKCTQDFWINEHGGNKTLNFEKGYWNTARYLQEMPNRCKVYEAMDLFVVQANAKCYDQNVDIMQNVMYYGI